MLRNFLLGLVASATLSLPALAQEYIVQVNGIVCEFCSYGVAKKVSKLPFIDRERLNKGVKVNVQDQLVTLAVKEGAQLDKDALFQAIEAGGYNPITLHMVSADGSLVEYQP